MALRLNPAQVEAIRLHGARDYPKECCGVLLGKADGNLKEVQEVVALKNLRTDPPRAQELLTLRDPEGGTERNRFLIDPRDQLRVEKEARARGLEVLGYYHSHPDHPAEPSIYDREHAWPWYSYVILAVDRNGAREMTSWVLANDQSQFLSEPIETVPEHIA